MSFRFLSSIDIHELDGARIIVRIDTNVPIGDDGIVDSYEAFRLDAILPTLSFLRANGARILLLGHHGGNDDTQSLRPIAEYLEDKGFPCRFFQGPITPGRNLDPYPIVLFDNLRLHPEETKNGYDFTCMLSSYGDLYVNEAFSVSHRAHASIVGIPEHVPSYLGLEYEQELYHLETLVHTPRGLGVIVGGSKFETKIDLIRKFIAQGTPVYIGGALAHTLYRSRGYEIGNSFVDTSVDVSDLVHHPLVVVPDYVTTLCEGVVVEKNIANVLPIDTIVDMGASSIPQLSEFLKNISTLLWNGPLGWYEKGYTQGTLLCAKEIKTFTGTSILGGGDTVALLHKEDLLGIFSFVSVGGGALLDYLLHGTLPGITNIED